MVHLYWILGIHIVWSIIFLMIAFRAKHSTVRLVNIMIALPELCFTYWLWELGLRFVRKVKNNMES